jgi:hypothetical protein
MNEVPGQDGYSHITVLPFSWGRFPGGAIDCSHLGTFDQGDAQYNKLCGVANSQKRKDYSLMQVYYPLKDNKPQAPHRERTLKTAKAVVKRRKKKLRLRL